jgi:hypothetical protein
MTRTSEVRSVPRLGRRGLVALERELTERDLAIVRSVGDFRFMTAGQIERLHFTADGVVHPTSARTARRTLERLARQRVLDRLERRIGGVRAGSAGFIYRLGPVGRRLVQGEQHQKRGREPSTTFLAHSLAIVDVFNTAAVTARGKHLSVTDYQPEPRCWRVVPGVGGRDELRPDLYIVLAAEEIEWHWFIEVDLATEHGPAIRRKCRQYQAYYQSGVEQSRHGVFPRVAWLTTTEVRANQIAHVIRADKTLVPSLFVVGTIDKAGTVLVPEGRP